MKVVIDSERCSGHGRCYSLSPRVFDSDDEGRGLVVAVRVDEMDGDLRAAAHIAVANCPEGAITVAD